MKESLKKKWWEFHKNNPHVYELFEKFTFQIIQAGFKNYSANAVFERIRWHTDIETRGSGFKLSNNHRAYYARYFHIRNPAKMNHERIAKIWGIILEREITPEEVVACMVGLKLARLAENMDKDDSWIDIIGYAALGGEIINDES